MESDDETTLLTAIDGRKGSAGSLRSEDVKSQPSSDSRRSSRRLSGKPPLQRVDEVEQQSQDGERRRSGCPDYFGVKSYLHFFYDSAVTKDLSIYEEDGFPFLNPRPRRTRCRAIWWKIFVWIGANLLVFGIVGVLTSYLLPRRPTEALKGPSYEYVNTDALRYNYNLDLCKLVSLIVFCTGGVTLIISLLFPIFLHRYCDEPSRLKDEGFKVNLLNNDEPLSPIEMTVPATSKLQNVQPQRKQDEAVMTKEGDAVQFKD